MLLVVAIVLVAGEVGAHVLSRSFSDVQHRQEIPETVEQIQKAPSPRVLFLGNSLTRRGISLDAFQDQLRRRGAALGGAWKVCPDDTRLRQWHYVYEGHFAAPSLTGAPEFVVVTFVRETLADQVQQRTRRLALNVEGIRQVGAVLQRHVHSLDEAAYFLAVHYIKAVAYQPEIKDGILRRLVPYYRSETRRLNQRQQAYLARVSSQKEAEGGKPAFTYQELQRFMQTLRTSGAHGIFCLMPLPDEQSLDPRLVQTIESAGMTFVDLRGLVSRTRGHYPDGYHMDAAAADIYSRAVADALAGLLPNEPPSYH